MAKKRPTPDAAERAADLLGLKVSDLGAALRSGARHRLVQEANAVLKGIRPNHRLAGELLAAAEACDGGAR